MIAAVFPGQGSQKPGMGQELYDLRPEAKAVFDEVGEATGRDLAALCFHTDEETLRQTENAQLALYTCGVAAWSCFASHMKGLVEVEAFAGHSVGEYAALAAAGVVSVAQGAKLVQRRGEIMAASGRERPGGMAAVLGLERAQIEAVLAKVKGTVVVANDNCPGQLVISGDKDSVQAAIEPLQAAGAKRVLPLNVSGAFHSPLMEESAVLMGEALRATEFKPAGRVFSNVTAQAVVQDGRWPELLEDQLRKPVRWSETVENLRNEGIKVFVECGVGEVLSGLIKRVDREAKTFRITDLESLETAVHQLRR